MCVSALIVFPGFLRGLPGSSTRNHPHEPTTSKPVVPGGCCPVTIEPPRSRPDPGRGRGSRSRRRFDRSSSLGSSASQSLPRRGRKAQCSKKANPSRGGDAKPGVSRRQPSRRLLSITARRRRRPDMEVTHAVRHPPAGPQGARTPRRADARRGASPAQASPPRPLPQHNADHAAPSACGDTNSYFLAPGGHVRRCSLPAGLDRHRRFPVRGQRAVPRRQCRGQSVTYHPSRRLGHHGLYRASTARCPTCGSSPVRRRAGSDLKVDVLVKPFGHARLPAADLADGAR